jgi:signal transduction histidine kinase
VTPRCRRLAPGRIALVPLLGLVAAHALTFVWIVRERGDLADAMMRAYVGRDVASSVAILERVPREERASWLARLARHNYHYRLDDPGAGTPLPRGRAPLAEAIAAGVADRLGAERVLGLVAGPERDGARPLWLRLRLRDGAPLTVVLGVPGWMPSRATAAVLAAQLAALALVTGLAVRLATRPLARLAEAADQIDSDLRATRSPRRPLEVARASAAFNAMRRRIAAALDERLRILAAIAHDLRTPLTRIRLRSELVSDPELRERLAADVGEMQALVEEGIDYARTAHAGVEAERPVDLHALLDSLVFDYQDAGRRVRWSGQHAEPLRTRPQALRRVITNLVNNALAFGGRRRSSRNARGRVRRVRDRGPGIAPKLARAEPRRYARKRARSLSGSRTRSSRTLRGASRCATTGRWARRDSRCA